MSEDLSNALCIQGKRVLVMAGGTGGHVFPALAIVRYLQSQGHTVQWLGTRGRIEEKLIPNEGIHIDYIDVKGVRRNGIKSLLTAPFMITKAILQAKQVMKTFKPDVVIGFGGYASGPGGIASWLCNIPLILHEQNAAAGLTNRLLSKFANRILLGVGEAFVGPKVLSVGNPLREPILQLSAKERQFLVNDELKILILGGSLGAQALNEHVPAALIEFAKHTQLKLNVVHQCGQGQSHSTKERYSQADFTVQTSDFISDMAHAYANADLIICRAGASTVSEVAAVKLPAIFVPLPTAVDDHQTKNAQSLVSKQGACLLPQGQLNAQSLSKLLSEIANVETLESMSKQAAKEARLNATKQVGDIVQELAK